MKKTKLFKSLLVAAGLCVGASAWAQTTTLLEYGTSDVAWSTTNLAEWTAGGNPSLEDGIVTISGGNGSYETSKTIAPTAEAIINVQAVWRGRSNTGRAFSAGNGSYFRFGNIIVAQNDQDQKHGYGFSGLSNIGSVTTFTAGSYRVDVTSSTWLLIEMEINTGSNTVKSFSIKSADGTTTYASELNIVLSNPDYTTIAFGYYKSGRVSTTNTEQLKSVKVTQTIKETEYAKYTVKYVCGDTEIKEASERSGEVDADIILTSSDTENFYANDKKYIYVSSDVEGKTVASDGSAVVTVTFREAEKYAWTANSNVGTYTISGETFEGDKASVTYPLYQLVEGKLWTKGATNSTFAQSFDVTENNQEFTLEYTETEIENVVFYTEMEDVDGMGVVNSGNAAARSSQRAAGYSASGNTKFTSLPAGKYQMYARFYSPTSAGGKFKFYAGNREIWAPTTENANATDVNTEIMLAQDSNDLFLGQCGATAAVDFVYIVKTADLTDDEIAEIQEADALANITKYYIVGDMNEWKASADYLLTLNEEATTTTEYYFKGLQLTTSQGFKVIGVLAGNTTWYPDGNNYYVSANGKYDIYFRPNYDGGNDWHYNCIYASKVDEYIVAGDASLFGTNWDITDTNNDMTENEDGTYSITYTNVALTGNVEYKVVKNRSYNNGSWPSSNRVIGISMAGNYDITIHFNPTTGEVYETMAVYKSVSDAGYATYCASYDLNFEGTGVKAFIAKKNDTAISFEEVTSAPANTGLLLKAAEGSYPIAMEVSNTNVEDNEFIGTVSGTTAPKGSFVLMNGTAGVGFYKTTADSFTIGANTAYLPASVAGARTFIGFDFEDNTTTAIEGVATVKADNGEIYNLQGQRVVKAQKGLYIINGKKVVVK